MEGVESEEDDAGPFEEFGVLRLPLKPGTASGYVGVHKRTTSKKRPWQATLTVRGRKRLRAHVGSFKRNHLMSRWPGHRKNSPMAAHSRARGSRQRAIWVRMELRPSPLSARPLLNAVLTALLDSSCLQQSRGRLLRFSHP